VVTNLAQPEGAPRQVAVGTDPVLVQARNDGATPRGEALVLSRGARGDLGVDPEPGSLTAIPSAGAARRYALGSPFNALSQTDDGRYAMAYFRPQSASGRLLYNPNEVAVVDLDAPPSSTNPTPRTVRSFGGVPNSVVFSPGIEIGGVSRRFAVVLSDAYVTLLDLDHGTYPYVTSSNPVSGGACIGAGVGPTLIDRVIGVAKAYTTRVGEGPFPTELQGSLNDHLCDRGGEFGTTTGRRRRCGWFDGVIGRYAVQVNGLDCLAITKLDVLDELDEIQVCVAYELDGDRIEHFPSSAEDFARCRPIFVTLPGW
jgi:hypothetical protein